MCRRDAIPQWLLESSNTPIIKSSQQISFVERTIRSLGILFSGEVANTKSATNHGFLQLIDPRAKLMLCLSITLLINLTSNYIVYGIVFIISLLYAYLSNLSLSKFMIRVWLIIPLTILIFSIPAMFNITIPGTAILTLVKANSERHWLSGGLYITDSGLFAVGRTVLRSGITLSFAYLVFVTTRFNEITLALTKLKLPKIFVEIIDMTYRYIFLIAKVALQMWEARYLRSVGNIKHCENRRFIGHMIAGIFIKSSFIAKEVHFAMLLRGYQGSYIRLQQLKYKSSDYVFLLSNGLMIMVLIYLSRI